MHSAALACWKPLIPEIRYRHGGKAYERSLVPFSLRVHITIFVFIPDLLTPCPSGASCRPTRFSFSTHASPSLYHLLSSRQKGNGVSLRIGAYLRFGISVSVLGTPAFAQPGQTTDGSPNDIVVTAQKREEKLHDVPVSVSVLSAATIDNNQIKGIDQLQQISPSISFTSSANTRGDGISIRGIGTLNFSDGVEPSVSTVVDGVVIGRSAASLFDFNDVSRIEVLRGPQGTLFGKNASAGVLNIVTQRPDLTRNSFDGSVSYGSYNDLRLRASSSIVLDPGRLALRVSTFRTTADGIITNLYNGNDLNNANSWGVRGKLLFQPKENFSIYVIGDYSRSQAECCVSTVRSALSSTRYFGGAGPSRLDLLAGQSLGPDNRDVSLDGASFDHQDTGGGSVEMNWDVGGPTVTSITAYRKFKDYDNNDTDGVPINVFNVNNARQHQRQFTQELRLSSPAGYRFEYVAGFYYFQQRVASQTQIAGGGLSLLPAGQFVGNQVNRAVNTKSMALFGQATWHLTDRFSLIGGGRFTADDIQANFRRTLLPGAVTYAVGLGGPAYTSPPLTANGTNFSYRAGAQYKLSSSITAYATATRGYKSRAINMINNLSAAIVTSGQSVLKPEISYNYEGGLRTSLWNHKVTLNGTGYYETVKDFQTSNYNAVVNSFTLANAGKLISRGAEIEATLRPAKGLSFSTNLAYTDTEVRDLLIACNAGQTAAHGCINARQDVSGSRLTNAPKWAFTVAGGYEGPIGSLPFDGIANVSYTYRSSVFFAYRDPNTVQPAYGLLNGSIGVETPDHRYSLTAYARNIANKHFATMIAAAFLDSNATGAGYTQMLNTDSVRTVGVKGAVHF